MRPEDLHEATRKKAESDAAAGRLGDDGHGGRNAWHASAPSTTPSPPPVVRRPHDIITLAKAGKTKRKKKTSKKKTSKKNRAKRTGPKAVREWLTAWVADDPADVIKGVFDRAAARNTGAPG